MMTALKDRQGEGITQSEDGLGSFQPIDDIALQFISIWNPQFTISKKGKNGCCSNAKEPGEASLMREICKWLKARGIEYEQDPQWGIHAVLKPPTGDATMPGVLLTAHLDSDNLDSEAECQTLRVDAKQRALVFDGQVGLDDKSGVAIVLSVLRRLQDGMVKGMPPRWHVHVLFTVGEESGQKGAFRTPIRHLLAGRVRHAIVVDRQTGGSGAPRTKCSEQRYLRHVVNKYKGVQLLDPHCREEMMTHLQKGRALALPGDRDAGDPFPAIESPNCADALELRGRWDAEVLAAFLLESNQLANGKDKVALEKAMGEYNAATAEIHKRLAEVAPAERVSSMNQPPRMTRYVAMNKVYHAVHKLEVPPAMWFSCVNLSYDYSDHENSCSLRELEATASIIVGFIVSYFSNSLQENDTSEAKE